MSLQSYLFKDFSGGLNTREGSFALSVNEAEDLMNVVITEKGSIRQREGKTRFDASGFPVGKRAEHLRNWYFGSTKILFASIDGDIYSFSVAGAGTLRVDGTAGSVWNLEQMQDSAGLNRMWAANGVDTPRRIAEDLTVVSWVDSVGTNNLTTSVNMLRVWRNRMVIVSSAEPQRLRFSAIANPESFTDADFLDVRSSDDDLDPITWMEIAEDNLFIFKKNSVWIMVTGPPNPVVERLGTPGAEDRFQSCESEGRCYFFHRSGVWSTAGDSPRMETEKIESYLQANLNYAQLSKVRMTATRSRRIYCAVPTSTSIENNRVIEVDPFINRIQAENAEAISIEPQRLPPAVLHDFPCSSLCIFRAANEDEIVAGDAADDEIHRLFVGSNDDGVAIDARWKSSWLSLVPEEPLERLRRVSVLMSGDAVIDIYRDFFAGTYFSKVLSIPPIADSLWDGGQWDGGVWDESATAGLVRSRPESRARYHQFQIRNNQLDKSFTIQSIEMVVRGAKERSGGISSPT
jgi:hypothetical protein